MRLRTKVSCAIIAGLSATSLSLFSAGCVGDDNVSPGDDAGVDATTNGPETSAPGDDASGDAGNDSTVANQDAGEDTGTPGDDAGDTGTPDTGVDAGCAPALAGNWAPPPYVPAKGRFQADCFNGNSQIDAFWASCLGDASTPSTCAAYPDAGTGNAGCGSCLLTPEDAGAYGAAVVRVVPQINVAGCIEEADQTDAGLSCATAVQAAQACAEASCRPSCTVTSDPASVAAYVACLQAAATSTCNTFKTAAAACLAAEQDAGGQAATTCLSGATAEDVFDDIGAFFCES